MSDLQRRWAARGRFVVATVGGVTPIDGATIEVHPGISARAAVALAKRIADALNTTAKD